MEIVIARPGWAGADMMLTKKGEQQARSLGETLALRGAEGRQIKILTSEAQWAGQYADILTEITRSTSRVFATAVLGDKNGNIKDDPRHATLVVQTIMTLNQGRRLMIAVTHGQLFMNLARSLGATEIGIIDRANRGPGTAFVVDFSSGHSEVLQVGE